MIQLTVQALKVATIAVLTVVVAFAGIRVFDYAREQAVAKDVGKAVTITIREDDTVDEVAKKLHDRGLIRYEVYFKTRMQVLRRDFKPGKHTLYIGMPTDEIIDVIIGDKKAKKPTRNERKVLKLVIREGWRTEQIAEELDNIGYEPGGKAFLSAVKKYSSDQFDFLADRPDEKSLEGYLFPDTYEIYADEPPEDIIQKLLTNFDQRVTPDMRQRAEEMGLTLNEVLRFASLVEREAVVAEERPIIADVYLKRYNEGWLLNADPTVQYAIGKRKGNWWPTPTEDDLYIDSPYNTYQNAGLPPGPICNPGLASIQAVLFPASTPYYYFVALKDDSGRHLFAATEAEQNQNINYINGVADSPAPGSDPFAADSPLNAGGGEGESVPIVPVGEEG
ncbi:MAG TPA: endolytic transglycosylase MltG [Thermomicrobiales bacterium]